MAMPGSKGSVLASVAGTVFFGGVIGPQRITNGRRGSYSQTGDRKKLRAEYAFQRKSPVVHE
jgi:hypothetical protein